MMQKGNRILFEAAPRVRPMDSMILAFPYPYRILPPMLEDFFQIKNEVLHLANEKK